MSVRSRNYADWRVFPAICVEFSDRFEGKLLSVTAPFKLMRATNSPPEITIVRKPIRLTIALILSWALPCVGQDQLRSDPALQVFLNSIAWIVTRELRAKVAWV